MRIELTTSSLPRKCSTTELQQLNVKHWAFKKRDDHAFGVTALWSGRPGSNRPPSAWKADALPNELLPLLLIYYILKNYFILLLKSSLQKNVGREGFEPSKQLSNRFTVCPIWPLWYLPDSITQKKEPMEGFEPPTSWLQISCSGQLSYIGLSVETLYFKEL